MKKAIASSRIQGLAFAHFKNACRLCTALLGICFASAASAQDKPVTPAEALQTLKDGNLRFVKEKLKPEAGKDRRIALATGQQPIAAIIACADSRVSPELIFNKGLGDLFVLRVAGNVVKDSHGIVGSAEYAVGNLKVPLVVVIGHENCGAIDAAIKANGSWGPSNLDQLLKRIDLGKDLPKDKKAALAAATRANAIYQAEQLLVESKQMRDLVVAGRIQVVPAIYSLTTGEVTFLDAVKAKVQTSGPGQRRQP